MQGPRRYGRGMILAAVLALTFSALNAGHAAAATFDASVTWPGPAPGGGWVPITGGSHGASCVPWKRAGYFSGGSEPVVDGGCRMVSDSAAEQTTPTLSDAWLDVAAGLVIRLTMTAKDNGFGGGQSVQLIYLTCTSSIGGCSAGDAVSWSTSTSFVDYASGELTVPGGGVTHMILTADAGVTVSTFLLEFKGDPGTEDCIGTGVLAWGNPDLSTDHPWYGDGGRLASNTPAGWGDLANHELGACLLSGDQLSMDYQFPTAPAPGDRFELFTKISCVLPQEACGVRMEWINPTGGVILDPTFGQYAARVDCLKDCVPRDDYPPLAAYGWPTAPDGATGIRITILRGTFQFKHSVANVEGTTRDPDHPDFACPGENTIDQGDCDPAGDSIDGPRQDGFDACEPGTDPLDVAGWLEYIACLTLALPGEIADWIGGVLQTLFVPRTLGAAWQSLIDLMATKVPTAWAVEVVGYLVSMVTAGNLAGGALPNLSTPWGTVTVDTGPITSAFAPYRPVGVAVVGLTLAVGIMRKVQATLGASG